MPLSYSMCIQLKWLILYISERVPEAPLHPLSCRSGPKRGWGRHPATELQGGISRKSVLSTERSISWHLCRQDSAPQAAGCCSLAEAALWPPAERGEHKDFAYRGSIKYHFKAEIHNFLHVQTTAAIERLILPLWNCFTSLLLACCVNVMAYQHHHRCNNYRSDLFGLKALAFLRLRVEHTVNMKTIFLFRKSYVLA